MEKHACFLFSCAALFASSCAAAPRGLPEGAITHLNIAYAAGAAKRQKLDLYLPAHGTNLPLIVWIHGGGWVGGDKENPPGLKFLDHGFALASLDYRLAQDAVFPAQLIDCKSAIRWLRAHAAENRIDPNRIGAWGASAGGHLVALLGTTGNTKEFDQGENLNVSSRVQCVCDWFGPTDLIKLTREPGESPITRLLGGPVAANLDKAKRANPIHYIEKGDPPFLIMHGDKDPLVPMEQSQLLADALEKADVPVAFDVVPNGGHGGEAFNRPVQRDIMYEFFVKALRDTPAPRE